MTFPATNPTLSSTWQDMRALAGRVKAMCETAVIDLDNPVSAHYVISLYTRLTEAKIKFDQMASVPGLGDYVKDQLSDQGINIVAEFITMRDAIQAATDEIISTFPVDSSGYLLAAQWSSTGIEYRMFSAASLSNLKTLISVIVSTIE